MESILITINNRSTYVRPHATVLQACESVGVDIPRFCYHENLSVAGNCRRCLVEIQKSPKPVASCAMPVSKGMVVFTDTPLVRKAREAVLEFLLINHPLDCPICDQGGECDLQDEALTYGSDRGRYFEFKRSVEDKECGPIVKTIRTRCIHCTRCVRFSAEVAGHETRGAFGRGEDREIGTYINTFIRTELSGNLVDLCPVGALTSKPYAFQARSWELQRVDTLDFFDALCSDITVHSRRQTVTRFVNGKPVQITQEEIRRVLPRNNGFYPENWISDRTRYAFDGLKQMRAYTPQVVSDFGRISNQSWNQFFDNLYFRQLFTSFKFVVGSQVNLEMVYSLVTFSKRRGSDSIVQGVYPLQRQTDAPFFFGFNRTFQSNVAGQFSGLFLIGTNLRYEASLLNTRFRREQNRRALSFFSVGVFNSFRYVQNHQGNSFRSLISFLENRQFCVQSRFNFSAPTGIALGVESLRRSSGYTLQRLVSFLGKRFFTKTNNTDRLGYVHSSIGTLSFAYLGVQPKTVDNSKNETATVFNIHNPLFSSKNQSSIKDKALASWQVNFDTHRFSSEVTYNQLAPITSLYEREGHVMNFEGRVRKQNKVVTPARESRSFETILSALCLNQGVRTWFRWTSNLSMFNDESPVTSLLDVTPSNFYRNPFLFEIVKNSSIKVKLVSFYQTVRDFYLQEPIAAYSPTRGECSLFIGRETNFQIEALLNK